ncbi:Uu.00g017800.m01.CDS01 [Anthostomella pinea]|uniref:Uu.00g017800.m01.CDS01 n=1 Tax=Anthostomella pinea TaxID=933095 RepID=A0AAI8VT59_9PEZI|nr:Uu.00g017800.m01.CDS01 [Anthostomella pinea]
MLPPSTIAWTSLLALFASVAQTRTYVGCFSSDAGLVDDGRYVFQSIGYCHDKCASYGRAVWGLTNGTTCLCGETTPSLRDVVEEANCNVPCAGYAMNICGGRGFVSVYLDENNIPDRPPNQTSTQSTQSLQSTTTGAAQPTRSPCKHKLPDTSPGDL